MRPVVLLLAGTREAREFAGSLRDLRFHLVASLAGVTRDPLEYPCETRSGGFGGVTGMIDWLKARNAAAIVDATHPFALEISRNAHFASEISGVPLITLRRKPWRIEKNWQEFGNEALIADALPAGARVFITSGRMNIAEYMRRRDVTFYIRTIEPVKNLPEHMISVTARPPYALEQETGFMRRHSITHLISKNAGGKMPAKFDAAESVQVKIMMLAMPPALSGIQVDTTAAALKQLRRL